MSYYDGPFEANEVDWSKKDDEGYWENKKELIEKNKIRKEINSG